VRGDSNTDLEVYATLDFSFRHYIASRLEKASNGQFKIKLYEPGKLVAPFEILDAVSTGKIDAGYASAGFWVGKMPVSPLFSSFPFGPEAGEYPAWMFAGNAMKLYQEMYDRAGYNVKVLICTVLPPETSGWFARPIQSPQNLKGLKIRFFGLGGRVMEKLGASISLGGN
jgi:TRAP-type mannitol/chloroaromatic compound transport system substrate-binding protein